MPRQKHAYAGGERSFREPDKARSSVRLIQFLDDHGDRAVAAIDGGTGPMLVPGAASVRDLALRAFAAGQSLRESLAGYPIGDPVDYEALIAGRRLLLPLDHEDPARCVIAITGLTHLGSASARAAMHAELDRGDLTDSMRMFKSGLDGGRPGRGAIGVQPEWAYKGDGGWAVPPEWPLECPGYAEDGGEEGEIAGLYVIGPEGQVIRVGYALGNEFSDHVMERRNYLYLAHSKLRQCSYGPELYVGELPDSVTGDIRVRRAGQVIWNAPLISGEANMSHSIANLEQHHFKYAGFRRPGDVHVYFYGASTLSFAANVSPEPGDVFEVECALFGAPLRNPLAAGAPDTVIGVTAL